MRTLEGRVAALERVGTRAGGAVIVRPGETCEQAIERSGAPGRAVLIPAKADAPMPAPAHLKEGWHHADA